MSILTLNNVSYEYKSRYNSVLAVSNASEVFEQGKLYAIIGKSGSGKTTLLSVMAGLDLPTNGEVLFDGQTTKKMNRNKYRRESISVIYQNFNLFPLLNSVENVMFPMELNGTRGRAARKRAKELLVQMGLGEHCFKNYPSMLSGGEQQRVAIARALATAPRVLLADEPTGNLDVENGNMVIDILRDLAHNENYCVIIITHDIALSDKADVVLEMRGGTLKRRIAQD